MSGSIYKARGIIAICSFSFVLVAASPLEAADCKGWNTKEYFQTATVNDVTACLGTGADEGGVAPIFLAAGANENPHVITTLLAAGARLNVVAKDGHTPLHLAAWLNQNPNVVTTLLDAGADAKARTKAGETPWDLAKENNGIKGTDAYWRLNDERF